MLASVNSCCVVGLTNYIIKVEVDVSYGLPCFDIVGLPDVSIRESKERVRAALKNSGFDFPIQRITINLSPGNLRKEGSFYDLPIALGILAATNQINLSALNDRVFVGELSLNGDIIDTNGVLVMADALKNTNDKHSKNYSLITSINNSKEASLIEQLPVYGFATLTSLVFKLNNSATLEPVKLHLLPAEEKQSDLDLYQINGQLEAKRGVEIAASGQHNLIMCGPPGSGKTMMAKRLTTVLPTLTLEEQINLTKIYSIAGLLPTDTPLITERPFIHPHHTCSMSSIIGGGKYPKPGLLTLACYGVIFLDELPEFPRNILEALRQPLEEHQITVARLNSTVTYPANFQLIAALNPCPCGFYGHPTKLCNCTPIQQSRYLKKISGPLLDRIDIQLQIPPVKFDHLHSTKGDSNISSASVRHKVIESRKRQAARWEKYKVIHKTNGQIPTIYFKKEINLSREGQRLLQRAYESLGLTVRSHDKILRIAMTIADLAEDDMVNSTHLSEAIQYRSLDRLWTSL